jgi:hypothetical protein
MTSLVNGPIGHQEWRDVSDPSEGRVQKRAPRVDPAFHHVRMSKIRQTARFTELKIESPYDFNQTNANVFAPRRLESCS